MILWDMHGIAHIIWITEVGLSHKRHLYIVGSIVRNTKIWRSIAAIGLPTLIPECSQENF